MTFKGPRKAANRIFYRVLLEPMLYISSELDTNSKNTNSEIVLIIAICIKVCTRVNSIKMFTFRAETSNDHISRTKGPDIMISYALESSHVALLRPGIFIIQN
jgi:hypothetical protein